MARPSWHFAEVWERAVRLVQDHRDGGVDMRG
jgi:hypothetical protein